MKYYLILICITVIMSGCKKMIEIKDPIDRITSDLVFKDEGTANLAVAGLYNRMMQNNSFVASGAMTLYCGMAADELANTSPGVNDEFYRNAISAFNSVVEQNFWNPAYAHIYHANAIIEGLRQSKTLSAQVRNQLSAEVKFVRAFIYFNLLNIFGDVPLALVTDYRTNSTSARTASSTVYDQIVRDLISSAQLPTSNNSTSGRLRPDKWAALSLLARVYLYKSDWNNSVTTATAVINSGGYSLEPNLNKVFKLGSAETIWELMPVVVSINTWEGNNFIPGVGSIPAYRLTQGLLSSFDSSDRRRNSWTQSTTVGGASYTYPFKYKVKSGTSIIENYVVLRLAEQYLIRAEAYAKLNNLIAARNDLNLVRQRAGLPDDTASSAVDLLSDIELERKRELFAEWGHRWLDLKRTNRADAVLSTTKASWQPTDILFPIPLNEIRKNQSLVQNPGY